MFKPSKLVADDIVLIDDITKSDPSNLSKVSAHCPLSAERPTIDNLKFVKGQNNSKTWGRKIPNRY